MRKWIPVALLLLAGLLHGQVIHSTAALDVDNVFSGANQFTQSLNLNESVCLGGLASTTILCAEASSHRLRFNPNATGNLYVVGISTPGAAGHCTQLAANGIDLADSGANCGGGGGGGVAGSGTTNTLPLWTNGPGSVLGNSVIQQPNSTTINMVINALTFTTTGVSNNTIATSVGNSGQQGQQIIITTSCGTVTCGLATYRSADATTTGVNGANVNLTAGSSSGSGTGSGGAAQISGGQAFGSGTGGDILLQSGQSTSGLQGRISLQPGNGGTWILKKATSQEGSVGYAVQMAPAGNQQTNFQVANGAPAYTCVSPTLYQRGDAPDISHFLYVCPAGGAFTAIVPTGGGGAVSSVFTRTGAVVATTGDYTAAQVTNAVSTAAANTGAAAMTLNMAASTLTSAFRVPNIAAATTITAGSVVYDTTNKNYHAGANGFDNIVGIMPASISPANNDCAKFTVSGGTITLNTTGTTCGAGGTITGSGLATFIPVFTGPTAIGNSLLVDDGITLTYTGTGGIAIGSTAAGFVGIGQGTAQGIGATAIGLTAPVAVTGYNLIFPGAAPASSGYMRWSNAANLVTGTFRTVVDLLGTNLDLTGQSTSLGTQTIVASTPAAGRYVINYYVGESAGCATPGPGVVTATFSWNDGVARTLVSSTLTFTVAPGAGDTIRGSIPLWASTATAITAITTYTACTTGTATYDIHAWVTEAQ